MLQNVINWLVGLKNNFDSIDMYEVLGFHVSWWHIIIILFVLGSLISIFFGDDDSDD